MDKKQLLKMLDNHTAIIWDNLCELYPQLVRYNPPIIKLNGRLYRVAGLCHQKSNVIELGYQFFTYSPQFAGNMVKRILPHEIIHQVDYNLYGLSATKCGHGTNWCNIMASYNQPIEKFHSMWITK